MRVPSEAAPQTKILSTTDGHRCTQIKIVLRTQQNLTCQPLV
jgi:hypothetical protein